MEIKISELLPTMWFCSFFCGFYLEQQHEHLTRTVEEQDDEIRLLSNQLEESHMRVQELEDENKHLKSDKTKLERENKELKSQLLASSFLNGQLVHTI